MAVKHMLPVVAEEVDVLTAYELTHQSMEQFIVNTHTDWFNTIDNGISKQLQANLLVQDKADREYLKVEWLAFGLLLVRPQVPLTCGICVPVQKLNLLLGFTASVSVSSVSAAVCCAMQHLLQAACCP